MLKPGDSAPDFTLESDSGKMISLSAFKGRTVIVYFYPKDDTPGCTREAQAFSEALSKLETAGAAVIGISKDSVASHGKFRDKYSLRFPLLSDSDLTVHKAFGAHGEKTMYGKKVLGTIRSTFVVDPSGTIVKVFPSVKVDGHVDAVLASLAAGGEPSPARSPKKVAAKRAAAAATHGKAAAKPKARA